MDLEYPKKLHDKRNLYPLAQEHVQVNDDMLSPFQRKYFPSIRGCVRKLVPNLYNKKKYVVHYRNLQLYANLDMKMLCIGCNRVTYNILILYTCIRLAYQ